MIQFGLEKYLIVTNLRIKSVQDICLNLKKKKKYTLKIIIHTVIKYARFKFIQIYLYKHKYAFAV